MRENSLKIRQFIISAVLICMMLCPIIGDYCFAVRASAEELPVTFSLVSPMYNLADDVYESYNINGENTSNFTPFDFQNEQRYEGMSFKLNESENNQIINQYVKAEEQENINLYDVDSLSMWIYFDSILLHNLNIKLEFDNGSILSWTLTKLDLVDILTKFSIDDIVNHPYAWNQIVLPFDSAVKTGDINNGANLRKVTKIWFDFSEENNIESSNYAKLRFYDINLVKLQKTKVTAIQKQDYAIAAYNFYNTDILNSLVVGDNLKLKSKNEAIKYAWWGDINLLDPTNTTAVWRVVFKDSATGETDKYNFGDNITLENQGTYTLFYQCLYLPESNSYPVVSGNITFDVLSLNAIYFSKNKTFSVEVGKTYVINVYVNSVLTQTSDIEYKSSSDNLTVIDAGNGQVEIIANKKGSYQITATVLGHRPANTEEKEYSAVITIKAENSSKNKNKVLKTVLFSIFGVLIITLVIWAVVTIIKGKRIKVK